MADVAHLAYVDSVASAGRRCVDALRVTDPRARFNGPAGGEDVGAVADLLGDVVHIWTWLVRARPRPHTDGYSPPAPPASHAERVERLATWVREAVDLLSTTDPTSAVAPMGRCDSVAGVAALLSDELQLHAADFEWVAGVPVGSAGGTLSVAALDRALGDRLAGDREGLEWTGRTVRLEATDVGTAWTLEAAEEAPGWWAARLLSDDAAPVGTLRGPAESLWRWAWHRPTPQPDLAPGGDDVVLQQVQAALAGVPLPARRHRWWQLR